MSGGASTGLGIFLRRITAGLLAAGSGMIWVQMGTVGVEWTTRLAAIAAAHGVVFVDAPVSGSEGPARAGQLAILAGGEEALVRRHEPLLRTMGQSVTYLGPHERPCAAKVALNLNLIASLQLLAESLALATRWGLPREQAVELIGQSAVVSAATKGRRKRSRCSAAIGLSPGAAAA